MKQRDGRILGGSTVGVDQPDVLLGQYQRGTRALESWAGEGDGQRDESCTGSRDGGNEAGAGG